MMAMKDLTEWLPVHVDTLQEKVRWARIDYSRLGHPFFDKSVKALKMEAAGYQEYETDFTPIFELAHQGLMRPAGFIFHVSRCGSTLLSNILKSYSKNKVVVEAQPIGAVLMPHSPKTWHCNLNEWHNHRTLLLKGLINAFDNNTNDVPGQVFFKFASWNILFADVIMKLWPGVPCLFVYRHPAEVVVSNLRDNSGWLATRNYPVFTAAIPNFPADSTARMRKEEHAARMLGAFYSKALQCLESPNAQVINYADFSPASIADVMAFFGVDPVPDMDEIENKMKIHSKDENRSRIFVPDSALKRQAASGSVYEWIERLTMDHYNFLELILHRKSKSPQAYSGIDRLMMT